MDALTF